MEDDKKRTLDSITNEDEPHKKKPLLNSNHDDRKLSTTGPKDEPLGPLTIEDIVDFQKEAIFRQMKIYKRERDLLHDKTFVLEKRYSSLEKSFLLLDEWWNQLIESLFPGNSDVKGGHEIVSCLTFALEEEKAALGAETPSFISSLEEKNKIIKSKISSWLSSHPSKSSGEEEIKQSLAKVNQIVSSIKIQNESLTSSNIQLTSQVDDLTEKYLTAEKNLERLQSPSLTRVQQSNLTIKRDNDDSTETNANDNDNTNKTSTPSPDVTAELGKLKSALDSSQATVSKQAEQIQEFQAKISSLNEQIQALNSRLINLSKSDLDNSDVFKSLSLRNEDLASQLEKLTAINQKLASEKSSLQINKDEFENRLRKEFNDKNDNLQQQILKAEQDVSRIRGARDEILSELNIKKVSESDRKRAFEELKSLVSIRETRIKTLEEEIVRLKDESDATASEKSISEHIDGLNSEAEKLDALSKLAERLQRQNKSLLAELPGLEQAFAQAHSKATSKIFDAIDQEAIVNKLKAEKVRADEKYFSAMRSKDQLSSENNRLKSQLTKSAELIQQLKDLENSKTQTITSLRKQVDDDNKSQESLKREIQSIKQSLAERQYRIESASRHIQQLKDDLHSKSNEVSREIDSRHSLEIETEKLKRQVDAKRLTTAIGNNPSAIEEQLEALRSIAICSLCSKNWKDTAIKVCGHVFCSDCAKDRLNARLRKCPMCNKQYSFNDLLSVHL